MIILEYSKGNILIKINFIPWKFKVKVFLKCTYKLNKSISFYVNRNSGTIVNDVGGENLFNFF
jgi:hypothetical protein